MLIVGAGGFAKELLCALTEKPGYENLAFFDDIFKNPNAKMHDQFDIIRSGEAAKAYFIQYGPQFALGIGQPKLRKALATNLNALGGTLTSVISDNCYIGPYGNNLQNGITALRNAIIEADNTIGEGCLIHCNVLISHDCTIGKYCELSPSAKLLGSVTVGDCCAIGSGATILPGVTIGNNVVIGAGAVVTSNIPDNVMAVGVPAQIKKQIPIT